MTVDEFQILLKKHGFNYGWDAASNALVGYEIALASQPLTPEMAKRVLGVYRDFAERPASPPTPSQNEIIAALRVIARGGT